MVSTKTANVAICSTPVKSTLNASAKSFVFSPNAPVWTPFRASAAVPRSPISSQSPSMPVAEPTTHTSSIDNLGASLSAKASIFVPTFYTPTSAPVIIEETNTADENPLPSPLKPAHNLSESFDSVAVKYDEECADFSSSKSEPEEEDFTTDASNIDSIVEGQENNVVSLKMSTIRYTVQELLRLCPVSTPIPVSLANTEWASKDTGGDANKMISGRDGYNMNSNYQCGNHTNRGKHHRNHHCNKNDHVHLVPIEDVKPIQINEETRWRPPSDKKAGSEVNSSEKNLNEASVKQATSILNKLSVEKFKRLSVQFIEVAIRNESVLSQSIEMIVQKAQMEWHFSAMYAELCLQMCSTVMPALEGTDEDTSKLFRKILLSLCQKQFQQQPSRDGFDSLPEESRLEQELILKRRILGHIRFIGELYLQNMISSRIMHECIQRLFGSIDNPDEESLECLCKLLSTIGEKLDATMNTHNGENLMVAKYYELIQNLSKSKQLCTRIRFLLQDLLEFRQNNWVARRKEAKATTKAEIHAEVVREEQQKVDRLNDKNRPPQFSRSHSDSRGQARNSVSSDGWETIPVQSFGSMRSRSMNNVRDVPSHGRSRDTFLGNSNKNFSSTTSLKDNRRDDNNRSRLPPLRPNVGNGDARKIVRRQEVTNHGNAKNTPVAPAQDIITSAPIALEVYKQKLKTIFAELISTNDMKEAIVGVEDLGCKNHHMEMIIECVNYGLEKSLLHRTCMGELLKSFLMEEIVTASNIHAGIKDLCQFVDDLEVDIPKVLSYLAEILHPILSLNHSDLNLSHVPHWMSHCVENEKCLKLICSILSQYDQHQAKSLFVSSQIDLQQLISTSKAQAHGETYLNDVLGKFNLSFLMS